MWFIYLVLMLAYLLYNTPIAKYKIALGIAVVAEIAFFGYVVDEAIGGHIDSLGYVFVTIAALCLAGAIFDSWVRYHRRQPISNSVLDR